MAEVYVHNRLITDVQSNLY